MYLIFYIKAISIFLTFSVKKQNIPLYKVLIEKPSIPPKLFIHLEELILM